MAARKKIIKTKAIIFDLDDTLFDCSNTCVRAALKEVSKELNKDLGVSYKALLKELTSARDRRGFIKGVGIVLKKNKAKNAGKLKKKAADIYYKKAAVGKIKPFPGLKKALSSLKKKGVKLVLLSTGYRKRQIQKVKVLGIKRYFDLILIDTSYLEGKKDIQLKKTLKRLRFWPEEIVSVGNRPDKEIKFSNRLGMVTVRVMKGKYAKQKPKTKLEKADYRIRDFRSFMKTIGL